MNTATVVYTKESVAEAIDILCKACDHYGYTAWSMEGPVGSQPNTRPFIARRICIVSKQIESDQELPADSIIGTAHLIRISQEKTRIAFRKEDLSGNPLGTSVEAALEEFCLWFIRILDSRDLRVPVVDPKADTRPLPQTSPA
ncbi:MAG: hypothetical protein PVJ07_02035 [Anaerolineales bacterium]|jgi:hypothetical protein